MSCWGTTLAIDVSLGTWRQRAQLRVNPWWYVWRSVLHYNTSFQQDAKQQQINSGHHLLVTDVCGENHSLALCCSWDDV